MIKILSERGQVRKLVKNAKKFDATGLKESIVTGMRRIAQADPETSSMEELKRIGGDACGGYEACMECGATGNLCHIGQTPDYDTRWQVLCEDCLKKALAMLQKFKAPAVKSA